MISSRLLEGFNQQIVNELHAMTSYYAIASYMDSQDLKVLAAHFFKQADEERDHALKLLGFLLEVGAKSRIGAIPEPRNAFSSVREAVEHALENERTVTTQINALMKIAHEDDDYASVSFLRWFVDEQVEEVASMNELLGLIDRAGDAHLLLVEDRILRESNPAQKREA